VPLGIVLLERMVPGIGCCLLGDDSLELGWHLALALCRPTVASSSLFSSFLASSCYLRSLTCLGFWNKASNL